MRMNPHPFDAALYPRNYRPSWVFRTAFLVFGAIGWGGLAMLVASPGRVGNGSQSDWWTFAVTYLAMAILGYVGMRSRITLGPSYIEVRGWRTRRLQRGDIRDYRRVHLSAYPAGFATYRIRATDRRWPLGFAISFKEDPAFLAWFATFERER